MTRMLLLTLCLSAISFADTPPMTTQSEAQAEIDATVWRSFKTAFETLDGEALNRLYADDVVRVTPAGIDTDNQFKLTNLSRFDGNRERGDTIALDFWFDSRRTNLSTSYEVGFYRIVITTAQGTAETHYGQFHIVLRKEGGHWKIAQDWDTTTIAGRAIDAELFNRQPPARF